jgi:MFS family permease
VLLRTAAKHELVAAMAWLTTPALIGPILGPPVGGFIVTYLSWRWIFDINIPIGLLGMVMVTLFVEDVREPQTARFDLLGLILSAVALASLMAGFETVGRGVVGIDVTLALLAAGLVSGVLYWLHARRHPAPLLDFSLFQYKSFAVAIWAGSLFRIGVGAMPFLLPLMLQVAFGDTALQSGMITFASAAGAFVMKPVAQRVLRRFGFRDTLVCNAALAAVMLGLCAAFRPSWPAAAMYVVLLVGGFFRSLQFTAYNTLAYAETQRAEMSAATGLYSTAQQLSLTIGISIGAASLQVVMTLSGHTSPGPGDFTFAFLVIALLALLASPMSLRMPRAVGEDMTGARRDQR